MKETHVHKYMRVKLGTRGFEVYKCMLTNCPHYIRRELVIGRLTICWRCGAEARMSQQMATAKKPTCLECRLTKDVA
jgi:hypothetical protein